MRANESLEAKEKGLSRGQKYKASMRSNETPVINPLRPEKKGCLLTDSFILVKK